MSRPEDQLLLALARLDLEAGDRASALALLGTELDWNYFLQLAAHHGLAPLLYRHLAALAPGTVPKAAFATLWARHEATDRRNRARAAELVRLLRLLDSHGIAAIPYKGPTLALAAYGDVALREFGDLDILLRPRDVLRAKALLQSLGYTPQYSLSADLEAALVRSRRLYELPLLDAARGLIIELQWRTDPDFAVVDLDDDRWWEVLQTTILDGEEVRALATRELLLVLCLHGTKHFWGSLGWLVDVAELVRRDPRIEWEWIVSTARRLGCERRLALGLNLASELLRMPLPPETRAIAHDPVVREIAAEISSRAFRADPAPPGVARAFRLNLRLTETTRGRLRYALGALLLPGLGEWTRWTLPRPLFFLYFPLRFARLAAKYFPLFGARKPQLPPRLEDHHGNGVGQVEAAVAGPHRQA